MLGKIARCMFCIIKSYFIVSCNSFSINREKLGDYLKWTDYSYFTNLELWTDLTKCSVPKTGCGRVTSYLNNNHFQTTNAKITIKSRYSNDHRQNLATLCVYVGGGGYIPRYITSTYHHRYCIAPSTTMHHTHPLCIAERSNNMKMWFEIFLYRVRAVPGGYREYFPDREDSRTGRLPVKPERLTPMQYDEQF